MNNIRTTKYEKDINSITITGTLQEFPENVRFVQLEGKYRTLFSVDMKVYRPKKKNEEQAKFDLLKIVIFDDKTS